MKTIIVTTQAELNALPTSFPEFTTIEIRSERSVWISVVARENSSVVAWGNSSVVAWGNSSVVAWGNSSVEARGNSSVVAWGNSSVEARGNSSVVARGNSSVVAWGNSSVEARENSSVEAWGNSSVVAWGNSSVEARGNSSVEAWGNSSVVAWGNSSVVARGNSALHHYSDHVALLFSFSVAWLFGKAKAIKKHKTATIIKPKLKPGVNSWLDHEGIEVKSGAVILFKRVSKDFKTQEKRPNETLWVIGTTLTHANSRLKDEECGAGKYHFCSRPYFCNEFRVEPGDKYIALSVPKETLYAWPSPSYPHKISGTKATVLYECDRFGNKITS